MKPILAVSRLDKTFGGVKVLREVSFSIEAGEFACVIGPSGCGKSTLLRLLLELEEPDRGELSLAPTKRLALVFQNFALFPWLTVEENVGFGLKMEGKPAEERQKTVDRVLMQLGLTAAANLHPKELSGGMKQRVGLGRALAIQPDILLLDEPFSSLDALTATELRKDLLAVWQKEKMTVLMVTHLVEEAIELADRVIVFSSDMQKPSVVKNLPIALPRPRNLRTPAFFRQVDQLTGLIYGQKRE